MQRTSGSQTPSQSTSFRNQKLTDRFVLHTEGSWTYLADIGLAARYERDYERRKFWRHNELPERSFSAGPRLFERGERSSTYPEGGIQFVVAEWAEAIAAAKTLKHWGIVEVRECVGLQLRSQHCVGRIRLVCDEAALRTQLPVCAAEDASAHLPLSRDLLIDVITSTESLPRERQWDGAPRVLGRGDAQHDAKHWTDAVSEYYAAIESGPSTVSTRRGSHTARDPR